VNVGDSRAFISKNNGAVVKGCTQDHKPFIMDEMRRVFDNGGEIYRVCFSDENMKKDEVFTVDNHHAFLDIERVADSNPGKVYGPWRLKPNGLTVSFPLSSKIPIKISKFPFKNFQNFIKKKN